MPEDTSCSCALSAVVLLLALPVLAAEFSVNPDTTFADADGALTWIPVSIFPTARLAPSLP